MFAILVKKKNLEKESGKTHNTSKLSKNNNKKLNK